MIPAALPPNDLPASQADAVARAVGCPDLFAIDACPATRPRLIQALAAYASRCRLLVLTPDRTLADRLVGSLGPRALRALAADEQPEDLPAAVASRTVAGLIHQQYADAEQKLAETDDRLAVAAATLDQLRALASRLADIPLALRQIELQQQQMALADFADSALLSETERESVKLQAEIADLTARRQELTTQVNTLRSSAGEVPKKAGLFSRLLGRPRGTDEDETSRDTQLQALVEKRKSLDEKLSHLHAQFAANQAARERLVAGERTRRLGELNEQASALTAEAATLAERFHRSSENLTILGLTLMGTEIPSVDQAFSELESLRDAVKRQRAEIRREFDDRGVSGPNVARGLLSISPAVIGPPECLTSDPAMLAVQNSESEAFDLLVLDGADRFSEADFLAAADLARRWILLGQARPAQDHAGYTSINLNGVHTRFCKGDAVAIDFFARLIGRLDKESWTTDADKLVRRFLPLAGDPRPLTTEPLLDRPEIELRFATGPDGEPLLAEIAFPAGTTAVEAKAFLYARLDEVLLRPTGESHTHDHAGEVAICWPAVDQSGEPSGWVELDTGVREKVVGEGPAAFTASVVFDKSQGWDASKAVAWLADHLPAGSPSRAAVLPQADDAETDEAETLVAVAAN